MNKVFLAATAFLAVLVVVVLSGCASEPGANWVDSSELAGTSPWIKTSRVVDDVPETPITVPMTYTFSPNGTYVGTDGAAVNPYVEQGTWEVLDTLDLHPTSNNQGRPNEAFSAEISGSLEGTLPVPNQFTLTYDSDIGGGRSIHIVETYTRTP